MSAVRTCIHDSLVPGLPLILWFVLTVRRRSQVLLLHRFCGITVIHSTCLYACNNVMHTHSYTHTCSLSSEKAHSEELQMQLLDSESNVEMLQMETSTLTQKVEALEEECEERSHQANTWYQALQVRRERREGKGEEGGERGRGGAEVVGGVEEGTTSSFSSRNWTQDSADLRTTWCSPAGGEGTEHGAQHSDGGHETGGDGSTLQQHRKLSLWRGA